MTVRGVKLKEQKQKATSAGRVPAPSKSAVSALVALALAGLSTGCATPDIVKQVYANDDPCSNNARNIGITAGVIGGGLAGRVLGGNDKTTGAVVGAGLGALIGGLIGHDIDRRRCELSKIAKANNLELTMNDIELPTEMVAEGDPASVGAGGAPKVVGMSVTVTENREQFAAGAARPTAHAVSAFASIAKTYLIDPGKDGKPEARQQAAERMKQMRILLIGHTDDTGSSQLNADLSEARAKAVAKIFADNGFSSDQIYYQGAGETLPIADNRTETGRAKNRRVEIVDLGDDQTFASFLASRKPNLSYYRPASEVAAVDGGSEAREQGADPKSRHTRSSPRTKAESAAQASSAKPNAPQTSAQAKSARPPTAQAPVVASSPAATPSPATTDKSVVTTSTAKVASASTVERNSATKAAAPVSRRPVAADIDFGGQPMSAQSRLPDIGKPASQASSFSLISTAHATEEPPPVGTCTQDRPRVMHGVKSLKNDQVARYATKDYLPGVYGTSWSDTVNGHLVALTNVTVLRDGGQPVTRPNVMVYKNYVAGGNPTPDFSTAADANAYQGSKAMLYRVFLQSGPLRCIDVVIPYKAASTAPGSTLVYLRDLALFQADFSPSIAR